MSLYGSRLTVFEEITFGDFWKNGIQRIHWTGKIVFLNEWNEDFKEFSWCLEKNIAI